MTKLQKLRKEHNKSLEDIVREVYKNYDWKVSRESLYRWEKSGHMPTRSAKILAEYFGVNIEDVINGE